MRASLQNAGDARYSATACNVAIRRQRRALVGRQVLAGYSSSMRRACVLLLLPIFAQCQSEVAAVRYSVWVRLWEGTGSSPGYCVDGLWVPEDRVLCTMQLPPGGLPDSGLPWRIVAKFGEPGELPMATAVRLPSALAERLVALARRGPEESQEQVALAAALVEASVVSANPMHREIQAIEERNAQTQPAR